MLQNSSPLFSFCHIPFGKANHLSPGLSPVFGRASPPHVGGGVPRRTVPLRAPHTVRTARAPLCGPVAVGRDSHPSGLPTRAAAPRRGAWLGIVHTLRVLHAAALSAAGPRTRRDVMIAPPFTHAITHGHGAIRRDGDIAPYRHYARKNRTRITRHRGAWLGTVRLGIVRPVGALG